MVRGPCVCLSASARARRSRAPRQEWLEAAFPARPRASPAPGRPPAPPRLSLRNTLAKFALDQTLGAAANTLLFSAYAHALRAAVRPAAPAASPLAAVRHLLRPGSVDLAAVDLAAVWAAVRRDFWPIVWAGMRFWPLVSLVNFALVSTLEARNLVAALAGIAWGVYMSLWAAS